jgi:HD-GYP domain-containing protein (c-di-GMP phosphodiesterase class II)
MFESIQELARPVRALFAALKARDIHTASHSSRTTLLARELGKSCSLTRHQLDLLHAAACVHDIGKIGIPDAVLLKPGRLDADEWTVMKGHSVIGSHMLAAIPEGEMEELISAVRHHHEGFDGKGYPDGLAGDSIPLMARIIALADSYDAMATTRPYHKPKGHTAIMEILYGESGGHYDPWLREKFTLMIETSPYRADRYAGDRHVTP